MKIPKTNLLVSIVYGLQGFSIAGLAFSLYLKETLKWSMMEMTTLGVITSIPWFLKIFVGLLSDSWALFGYRRKSYLALATTLGALAWLLLYFINTTNFWFYAGVFFIESLCAVTIDVCTDGFCVQKSSSEKQANNLQNLAWGSRAVGAMLSGVLSGWVVGKISVPILFLLECPIYLTQLPIILFLDEVKEKRRKAIGVFKAIKKSILAPIKEFIRNKKLIWISIFILLCAFSPSLGTPLFFRYRDVLHFSPQFLGNLSSIGSVGDIIGCILFIKFFSKIHLTTLLKWAVGIWALNTFLILFITNEASAIIIALCSSILGYIAFIPLLSISAKVCNTTKNEATLFAIICSLNNISGQLSSLCGTWLIKFVNFETLVWISTITTFIVIPIIPKICSKEKKI